MSLTADAKAAAKYLVNAWGQGIIESYFELIDITAGNATSIETAPGLGVLKSDEFDIPSIASLMELADWGENGLIRITEKSTTTGSRKWVIQLTPGLRDIVDADFPVTVGESESAGILPLIFISYKREDRDFVERLAQSLRRVYGYDNIWFDKVLRGGQEWWREIVGQIASRNIFIYVVSREALESVYCRAEYTEARRLLKRIIPLQIRKATCPADLARFQILEMVNGMTVENIVEVFAAITQQMTSIPPISPESLWAKRTIQPIDGGGVRIRVAVPANREPNDGGIELCNTGVLLIPGDELNIVATGEISVDNGETWSNPNGVFLSPEGRDNLVIHPRSDAYRAAGYPQEIGDRSLVGSLIGWIGERKGSIDRAFLVGNHYHESIGNQRGFLYLALNDVKGMYSDNLGQFDVTVDLRNETDF